MVDTKGCMTVHKLEMHWKDGCKFLIWVAKAPMNTQDDDEHVEKLRSRAASLDKDMPLLALLSWVAWLSVVK